MPDPTAQIGSDVCCETAAEAFTDDQTVDAILGLAGRRTYTPLRHTFIQQGTSESPEPGPLRSFVSNGGRKPLVLYLLAMSAAGIEPWDVTLAAGVWSRALGVDAFNSPSATVAISRIWQRLEARNLIRRSHSKRLARIHMLKEDGSGDPYEPPSRTGDRSLRLPRAFWQAGPQDERWYRVLKLSEIAMLLIALSLSDEFRLPEKDVRPLYGISTDTARRGLVGLVGHGILTVQKHHTLTPMTVVGYTTDKTYTLQHPFVPERKAQPWRPL